MMLHQFTRKLQLVRGTEESMPIRTSWLEPVTELSLFAVCELNIFSFTINIMSESLGRYTW